MINKKGTVNLFPDQKQFIGDRKKSSEWTNLAKIRDFGLPEG